MMFGISIGESSMEKAESFHLNQSAYLDIHALATVVITFICIKYYDLCYRSGWIISLF
jgi:uncharacterized membrane protein YgdD (TMEM256/DUF423 family)